jgi:hypothetical protein
MSLMDSSLRSGNGNGTSNESFGVLLSPALPRLRRGSLQDLVSILDMAIEIADQGNDTSRRRQRRPGSRRPTVSLPSQSSPSSSQHPAQEQEEDGESPRDTMDTDSAHPSQ